MDFTKTPGQLHKLELRYRLCASVEIQFILQGKQKAGNPYSIFGVAIIVWNLKTVFVPVSLSVGRKREEPP